MFHTHVHIRTKSISFHMQACILSQIRSIRAFERMERSRLSSIGLRRWLAPTYIFNVYFSSPDPPPDVEFFNPLYSQHHNHDLKDESDSLSTCLIESDSRTMCTMQNNNENHDQVDACNSTLTSNRQILNQDCELTSVTC